MNKIIFKGALVIGAVIVGAIELANKKEPVFEGNGIVADKYRACKDRHDHPALY